MDSTDEILTEFFSVASSASIQKPSTATGPICAAGILSITDVTVSAEMSSAVTDFRVSAMLNDIALGARPVLQRASISNLNSRDGSRMKFLPAERIPISTTGVSASTLSVLVSIDWPAASRSKTTVSNRIEAQYLTIISIYQGYDMWLEKRSWAGQLL